MLVDHIAWYRFPESAAPGFIMHMIGRITAPVMCYFIAEGYYRTRNIGKYALRLLIFAVIAQFPYCYYMTGRFAFAVISGVPVSGTFNVLFTLLLGLLALRAMDSRRLPRALRVLIAATCCAAAFMCDWPVFGVMFILAFGARHGDFRRQAALFCCVAAALLALMLKSGGWGAMFQAGVLLSLPLLRLYNGKRGGNGAAKWAFYVFYPLHLLVLAVTRSLGFL